VFPDGPMPISGAFIAHDNALASARRISTGGMNATQNGGQTYATQLTQLGSANTRASRAMMPVMRTQALTMLTCIIDLPTAAASAHVAPQSHGSA
jgi:hypothetical protein